MRRRGHRRSQILPRLPRHHVPGTPAPRALASPRASSTSLNLGSRPRWRGFPPIPASERRSNGERGLPSPGLPAMTFSPPGGWPGRPRAGGKDSPGVPAESGPGLRARAAGRPSRLRAPPPERGRSLHPGERWGRDGRCGRSPAPSPPGTPHGRAGPLRLGWPDAPAEAPSRGSRAPDAGRWKSVAGPTLAGY